MALPSPTLYPDGTTGRYLVPFQEEAAPHAAEVLEEALGVSAAPWSEGVAVAEATATEAVVFDRLGVAVVAAAPQQAQEMGVAAAEHEAITAFEPERVVFAIGTEPAQSPPGPAAGVGPSSGLSAEYLRGFGDAAHHLAASAGAASSGPAGVATLDESQATWGLQAIGVLPFKFSGEGILVAVLDTGIDETHPDFANRHVETESFVPGETVQDGHGHGTHCIGTASGSSSSSI